MTLCQGTNKVAEIIEETKKKIIKLAKTTVDIVFELQPRARPFKINPIMKERIAEDIIQLKNNANSRIIKEVYPIE